MSAPITTAAISASWLPQTATPEARQRYGITRASVVIIDCDLYSSTREALAFCALLLGRDTIFVFDDWNASGLADRNRGEALPSRSSSRRIRLRAQSLAGLNYKDKVDPEIPLVTGS